MLFFQRKTIISRIKKVFHYSVSRYAFKLERMWGSLLGSIKKSKDKSRRMRHSDKISLCKISYGDIFFAVIKNLICLKSEIDLFTNATLQIGIDSSEVLEFVQKLLDW